MRAFLPILFCLFIIGGNVSGQESFKVIKVNGTIVLKAKGVSLETGTVFSEKEDLLFRTDDASAAVINSQKGRLILTSGNHNLSAASSNYLPAMYNISTRGGSLMNLIDLQNHFSGNYVVLEKQQLVLDPVSFPLDEDNYFFLRYIYKGEEINKKLSFSDDTLIIDKKSLYTVDGQPIPSPDNTSIKLYYSKAGKLTPISQFNLIFPETKQLKSEVKIILDTMKNIPAKEKIGEVSAYITEQYGKVYQPNLLAWLDKNFGLRAK